MLRIWENLQVGKCGTNEKKIAQQTSVTQSSGIFFLSNINSEHGMNAFIANVMSTATEKKMSRFDMAIGEGR